MNFVSSTSGINMGRRQQREREQGQGKESKLQESRRKVRRGSSNNDNVDAVLAQREEASSATSSSASSSTHEFEGDNDDDDEQAAGLASGWRRADRLARATATRDPLLMSTSRLELHREKGILEDALKDRRVLYTVILYGTMLIWVVNSLSTLLMLRPANTSAKVPDFLTAPHSHPSPIPLNKPATMSEHSLSTSPSSTVTATAPRKAWAGSSQAIQSLQATSTQSGARAEERGSSRRPNIHRRRTVTTLSPKTASSVDKGKGKATKKQTGGEVDDLSANWAEATLSSTSSFEDLGFDDFEDDEGEEVVSPTKRKSSIYSENKDRHTTPKARRLNLPGSPPSLQQSASPQSISATTYHARTTPRPQRPSKPSSALRRSAPPSYGLPRASGPRSGIQSEPELSRDDLQADDTFLELLEAAKTFMSMSPSAISSSSTAGSSLMIASKRPSVPQNYAVDSQRRKVEPEAVEKIDERAITPTSPQVPTSMSTSTTFVLSSSDSPPSYGLASSREGLDDDEDGSGGLPSPTAQQESIARSSLTTTVRSQEDERRHSGYDELAQEKVEEKHSESAEPTGSGNGGWWDWLSRQYKRITFGIGLLGIGFVIAIGVGLIKKPSIRRR